MGYKKTFSIIFLTAFLFAIPFQSLAGLDVGGFFKDTGGFIKDAGGAITGFGKSLVGLPGNIAGAIGKAIFNVLINLIFQIPLAISATLWLMAAGLLKYVLSPGFLGIPITSPDFEAVYRMWQFVRDFTNMLFVLALVAIGLGTALRYGEYQLQKALPRLILIALLINFTPVIIGVFIDAANITIRFLVSDTAGDNLAQMARKAYDGNLNLFKNILDSPIENLAAATAQLIFNTTATIVYLLFFVLYLFRYVALIILFILSPLAFFSYILPITRGFWSMWWRQFIAWLIIGISGAFFILLSAQMVGVMWDIPNVDVGSGIFKGFTEFVNVFITAMVPVAMLIIGFFLSLQTTAMGAQVIIRAAGAAGVTARERGLQWGKAGARAVRQETGRIRQTYQRERVAFGESRMRAARTALGGTWGRVRTAALRPATYAAAGRGIAGAVRAMGEAGLREALGWKRKTKEERPTCPRCGNYVPANANNCPHCGLAMPTCPQCGRRTVPGARFCQRCGTQLV